MSSPFFPRLVFVFAAAILLSAASSCSDSRARGDLHALEQSPLSTVETTAGSAPLAFSGLPEPLSLLASASARSRTAPSAPAGGRQVSAIDENGLLRGGDDYDIQLNSNLSQNAGSADFSPTSGSALADRAFGLYRFNAQDYDRQATLRLRWSSAPPSAALWIGLGNFSTNRWDWIKASSKTLVTLDGLAVLSDYISVSGELLAVVLLTGSQGATLEALRLGDPLMSADFKNSAGSGHFTVWAPTSGLSYKSTSSIASGSITNYEWDLDGDGDYEVDTDAVDEVLNASVEPGVNFVNLRITSDWETQAVASRAIRGLAGSWTIYPLTDYLNDAQHTTTVRTPLLLGSRADSGEFPLILWSVSLVDSSVVPALIQRRISCLLGDDPTLESWTPVADVNFEDTATPINYILQDAARLSGGECGLTFVGDDPGDTNLYYVRSTDASAGAWTQQIALGGGLDSQGGACLEELNGDLYCAYVHGGAIDLRKNSGTTSEIWENAVSISAVDFSRFAVGKPALALGLQWPLLDQQLYCCAEILDNMMGTDLPAYFNSDPAGASFLYQHALDAVSPSGLSMSGGTFRSSGFGGSLRSIFAYKVPMEGDLNYIKDDPQSAFTGQLSDGISLGLPNLPLGEVHVASSLDNINNLSDAFMVFSLAGGGLIGLQYLEDLGWFDPGPDSGSSIIEPSDPGDAGSQPCCAWIQGRPAVVYVDYATQNIRIAVLN